MNRNTYFRSLFLTISALGMACTLQAQVRQDIDVQEWPAGTVTLTTGEVLEGVITYYRAQDIVTVLPENGRLHSLSPVNVEQFEVKNDFDTRRHLFKTIYWNQGKDYTDFKKPTFFELLTDGNVTLLMRESYYKRTIDTYLTEYKEGTVYDPMGYPIDAVFADQIKPQFFVMQPDGKIILLQHARRDFLNYCGKKASQVKSFARKQKLSFDAPMDFKAIVTYYNTLL
ncbi:hypothetical protein H7F15_08870 [Pontibacter sp. Tf4]|uniref:hypothetical protein n=1 Tax=Pontibacter sp. Tf4 TaxID=2761620 RepID=UPI001624264D|nr:hypothetical protein [Pontibacter sp. Tf4]MBB6611146.1 hypothetical protein [Pontibacter sp. Tf4]